MAKIMKPYFPQPIPFQNQREMLGDVVGLYQLSHRIYIKILLILAAIHTAAKSAVFLLLGLYAEKEFFKGRDQGQGSAA